MARAHKFWDRLAGRYAKQPLGDEGAYLQKLNVMREYLASHMDVLEFGCGTGATGLILGPQVRRYRAIDFSGRMIDIARDKAERGGIDNVEFECAAFDSLELKDGSLDAVIAMNVLHLLANWRDVIPRVYAALKPGGVFISSTVCLGDRMAYLRYVAPVGGALGLLPVLRVFTQGELETALAGAGFVVDHRWQPGEKSGIFIIALK